ncbi:MAG: C40 family peptidase, partial [Lachnospiraceae bacterium]|nr:C40 family peptidase [Lachnospiraceae bacterium]
SIEEERAQIARQKELEERKRREEAEQKARQEQAAADAAAAQAANGEGTSEAVTGEEAGTGEITPAAAYSTNQELRDSLVEYALQFVGNRYVNGGNSLTEGTDCSGFTKLIYAEYGYSLGRTPASQLSSAGRSIDYSEIQKGDIICYSSNGGKSCTHVAIYIGDGMIVHAANSKKGICTQKAIYSTIMGVKNIID